MEDGKHSLSPDSEKNDVKNKTLTPTTDPCRISQVNGHSFNGVDLNDKLSQDGSKSYIQNSGKYLSGKVTGFHPGDHGKDVHNLSFRGNNRHMSNYIVRGNSLIDNYTNIRKKNNTFNKCDKTVEQLTYHDNYSAKSKTINKFIGDKDQKRTLNDRPVNAKTPVRFKCLRCKSASFKSLGLLKEHQRECDVSYKRSVSNTQKSTSRKVYLCSVCRTYYENWNLFLHMREVHNRHICLFCLGMFSKAERLATHLVVKHEVSENKFRDVKDFFSVYSGSLILMCCCCDKVQTEKDNFTFHDCIRLTKQPTVGINAKNSQNVITPCSIKLEAVTDSVEEDVSKKNENLSNHCPNSVDKCNKNLQKISTDINYTGAESCTYECKTDPSYDLPDSVSGMKQFDVKCEMQDCGDDELDKEVHNITKKLCNDSIVDSNSLKSSISCKAEQTSDEIDDIINSPNKPSVEFEPSNNNHECVDSHNYHQDKVVLKIKQPITWPSNKPKRNRRPPKRYEYDADDSGNKNENKTIIENIDAAVNNNSTTIELPIPKLKVKLPMVLKELKSDSECSTEFEENQQFMDDIQVSDVNNTKETLFEDVEFGVDDELKTVSPLEIYNATESDIAIAGDDILLTELTLDKPLDKYPIKNLLKTFLSATVQSCIYCNHVRKIAVNGKQLAFHFLSQHRFSATVNSITAEELHPQTISTKIQLSICELSNFYMNLETYNSDDKLWHKDGDNVFECFQCYFRTSVHKELYFHNRKLHQKTILLCIMCKSSFYCYSELLCHLCPGGYDLNKRELCYRCCYCENDSIPSAFRLMVHLRKCHHACDVCLEICHNQTKLSNHVWKHKLHHLCYRCDIAYRNKPDITKHLFWKHGTESVLCKKCLQKKWPHVYHFCIPPNSFMCDECSATFSKAVALKVHKRIHSDDKPYVCTETNCTGKFISKKILEKHLLTHNGNSDEMISENDKNDFIDVVNPVKETILAVDSDIKESTSSAIVSDIVNKTKTKKTKRDKKVKEEKDNLLLDVNLPALNLSESDSEESEAEENKGLVIFANPENNEMSDIQPVKDDNDILQMWNNLNQFQTEIKKYDKQITIVKTHVCDSDHDYCLLPSEKCCGNTESDKFEKENKSTDRKKKKKSKKKQLKDGYSSLSDSSSDSESTCSCGSNCSCSSSSASSSSNSTSSDSDTSTYLNQNKKTSKRHSTNNKHSESSHTSAVDIMAMEEPILKLTSERVEIHIPESDLLTDETDTDEDFYDEYPQKAGKKIDADKQIQLAQTMVVSPVGNGSVPGITSPSIDKIKKKVKTKKRKKTRKDNSSRSMFDSVPLRVQAPAAQNINQNKITISLQKNCVQLPELPLNNKIKTSSAENDNKRASKRKRVPNKFYGYSSDDDYVLKPQQPPKLEWRKEDLPSPTPSPSFVKTTTLLPEIQKTIPPLIIPKSVMSTDISSNESDSSVGDLQICQPYSPEVDCEDKQPSAPRLASTQFHSQLQFPKPAGARQAREGESVYCYCRCPYDEVSEMIACDGDGCNIEWFHFECVGILVPPKGKWYCPQCEQKHISN